MLNYIKIGLFIALYNLILILALTNDRSFVKFYDVGQGDAALVHVAGKNILIDGGPFYTLDSMLNGDIPYLGCDIDLLVVTHAHFDHYSGARRVAQRCRFKEIWEDSVYLGSTYSVGPMKIYVAWPPMDYRSANENNNSIVALVSYRGKDILFMGDIELGAISQLDLDALAMKITPPLEFYKSSHHGSKNGYSQYLIDKLKPQACIISLGDNNYGHPDPDVILNLETSGCKVYRTDKLGSIEFSLD